MQTFRILCFSGNVLTHWKEHRAADIVACLAEVHGHDCPRIEIWRGSERLAVLKEAGSTPAERPALRQAR